jgi:hypothetical protein
VSLDITLDRQAVFLLSGKSPEGDRPAGIIIWSGFIGIPVQTKRLRNNYYFTIIITP